VAGVYQVSLDGGPAHCSTANELLGQRARQCGRPCVSQ